MKYLFIVNPTSGKGKGVRFIPIIDAYFKIKPADYTITITEYPKHAQEIAATIKKEDDTMVVAVGGDGTANEVLNGLNPGVKLCVLPAGTGNDFYKSVDSRKLSDSELFRELMEGEDVMIDYGVFNDTMKFMNVASFGVDADINVYACDYVKVKYNLPGSIVYAYSALKVGTHPKDINIKLIVDGKEYNRTCVLATVNNGKAYGGCFKPTPNARLDDGLFDICVVNGPIKLPKFFKILVKYISGTHLNEPEVELLHGKNVVVEYENELYWQIDGENKKYDHGKVELFAGALSVRMPINRVGQ